MTRGNFILNEEEISQLENYVKTQDTIKIVDLACRKYDDGCKIRRVHSTDRYINVHTKKVQTPYKFKIEMGKEKNKTLGEALFLHALGLLSDIPPKNNKIIVQGYMSTKHKKVHTNHLMLDMMEDIENIIKKFNKNNLPTGYDDI